MSEESKAIIRRAFEEIGSKGNIAFTEQLFAADFVRHDLTGGPDMDREAMKAFLLASRAAFPDMKSTVEDIVAEGDKVVVRYTSRGTHQGEFMGMAPTGKVIVYCGINIYLLSQGKIKETWQLADRMSIMWQTGALH